LRSAEPYPTEVVTRARNRDSAVRTATSLLSLTTCDHLDKKHIPVRGADASEFSAAVELGVIGLASGSGEGEHDVQFRFAADLSDLAGPSPCDCGRRGRGSGSRRRFCTWFGSRRSLLRGGGRRVLRRGSRIPRPSAAEIPLLRASGDDRSGRNPNQGGGPISQCLVHRSSQTDLCSSGKKAGLGLGLGLGVGGKRQGHFRRAGSPRPGQGAPAAAPAEVAGGGVGRTVPMQEGAT